MMATDFFDDDLIDSEAPAVAPRGEEEDSAPDGIAARAKAESVDRMAKQKEDVSHQVAGTVSEIERLRLRQEHLEKERSELEQLTRRQEQYEGGKRDIIEKLDRSIVLLEKEELQAKQMVELLGLIRGRFKDSLAELRDIHEDAWSDEAFQDELNKALVLVEEARADYKNGLAKIEASSWHKGRYENHPAPVFDHVDKELHPEKGFGFWLKVGVALSLPIIIVLVTLFVVNHLLMGMI